MATKKATTTKKTTARKPAAKRPATRKAATTTKVTTVSARAATPTRDRSESIFSTVPNIMIAELVGTFVLTMVALYAVQLVAPLFVGLTLVVLVFAIGAVSGSHVNPAVTFALWTMRKVKTALVPFYWVAQFLGAMLAVVLMSVISGAQFGLDFSSFGTFSSSIFWLEVVSTAVFLFGLTAALLRDDIKSTGKALGIGLSLMIGVLVSLSLFASINSNIDTSKVEQKPDASGNTTLSNVPHEMRAGGAMLNPAVALAATEKTDTQLQGGGTATKDEPRTSRLSWEVILGTLLGAAIGGNLYLLVAGRLFRSNNV